MFMGDVPELVSAGFKNNLVMNNNNCYTIDCRVQITMAIDMKIVYNKTILRP
jgi:hypothetical protein